MLRIQNSCRGYVWSAIQMNRSQASKRSLASSSAAAEATGNAKSSTSAGERKVTVVQSSATASQGRSASYRERVHWFTYGLTFSLLFGFWQIDRDAEEYISKLRNSVKEFRHENEIAQQVLRHTISSLEDQLVEKSISKRKNEDD